MSFPATDYIVCLFANDVWSDGPFNSLQHIFRSEIPPPSISLWMTYLDNPLSMSHYVVAENKFKHFYYTSGESGGWEHGTINDICMAGRQGAVSVHNFGEGKVIWLPSAVSLGAWVSGDYKPLSDYLVSVLPISPSAVSFDRHHGNVLMRTLQAGKERLVICVNKSTGQEDITLANAGDMKAAKVVFASPGCGASGNKLTMMPEGVLVIRY